MIRIYKTHLSPETLAKEASGIFGSNYVHLFSKPINHVVTSFLNRISMENMWEATGTFTPCDKKNKVLYDENWATTNFSKREQYLRRWTNSEAVQTDDIFKPGEKVITERIIFKDASNLERIVKSECFLGSPDLLVVSNCYEMDDEKFERALSKFKVITERYMDVWSDLFNPIREQFYDLENNRSRYRKLKKEMDKKLLDTAGEKPSFRKFLTPYVA